MQAAWSTEIESAHVYGLTLREPLTIAHIILLAELGSPVVLGGPQLPGDIALAVYVCAWPASVSRRKMRSVFASIGFKLWGKLVDLKNRKGDAEKFATWFSSQCGMPPRWSSGAGRTLGTPWWINRVSIAMSELGMSYKDATELPCKLVGQLVTANMEAKGLVELETEEQTNFIRWAMEQSKRN